MEKLELKKIILQEGIKAQQVLIDDFQNRINDLKESETSIDEDTYDSGDQVRNDQAKERVNLLTTQLNMVKQEMDKLNSIITEEVHQNVHLGSVVKTNQRNFFISVSIENFNANSTEYFGVSTKSPIYRTMEGKKIGDHFEYNEKQYEILDLF